MKKLYLFLTLLLAMVGFGVTHALIATVVSTSATENDLKDGMKVLIGCNITNYNGSVGNHTFGNYHVLLDNGTGTVVSPLQRYALSDALAPNMVWELVEAKTDEDGTWYYLKNAESGFYISYNANPYNQDITDPESLSEEGGYTWFREDWTEGVIANCDINLVLVDTQADAKPFLFKKPSEGTQLLGYTLASTNENVADLIATVDDSCLMMIAKVEVCGQVIYVAANDAYQGDLSRYGDWAVYYSVIEATIKEDPREPFAEYMDSIATPEFQFGNYPGCVVEEARAQYVAARLEELRSELDNKHSDEEWSTLLTEAQSLVAEVETFTYRPMVAGYYRFISTYPAFEQKQGVKKAMYSEDFTAKWGTLNEDALNQLWEVTEENGHFYVKNVATQLYFTIARQNITLLMHNVPTWVEFRQCSSYGDFNLITEGEDYPFHSEYHLSGDGVGGNIVGWDGGSKTASSWNLISVSEEEINETWGQDEIEAAMIAAELNILINDAKVDVAKAKASSYQPLVTAASQISSPKTETSEGSIDALIDGDYTTFWHSTWMEESVDDDEALLALHYLQFDLGQAVSEVTMKYARRSGVVNDHPTKFTIWASNEADGEFVEVVSEFNVVDNGGSGADKVLYSYELDFGAAYRYIRVRATMTDNWRGFWHASEMNFYTLDGVDLWAKAEPAASALEAAIAEAEALTTPTREDIAALRAAYDDFLAVYTDPTTLNNLIAEAGTLLASVEYGDEAGQKPVSAQTALANAIADAQSWLEANLATCTKAELTEQEDALQEAIDTWKAVSVNPDLTTAIESVAPATVNNTMYDLSGRSVTRATKGLYIINGKKVLIK